MEQNVSEEKEIALCEIIEAITNRYDDLLEAYGPDFAFSLANSILWYLRLKNGMFIANTTEGKLLMEIVSTVKDSDTLFTEEDLRYIISEVLLYVSFRINKELGQIVDNQNQGQVTNIPAQTG